MLHPTGRVTCAARVTEPFAWLTANLAIFESYLKQNVTIINQVPNSYFIMMHLSNEIVKKFGQNTFTGQKGFKMWVKVIHPRIACISSKNLRSETI